MQQGFVHEGDEWVHAETILSAEKLAQIDEALQRTVVIVEHWHYRGASAPTRLFIEEQQEFLDYLNEHARPGDAFRVWPFDICSDDNAIVIAKYPDKDGRVPLRGAY